MTLEELQAMYASAPAPADNITSNNGYTKSATRPTSGGVSNVIEGDDIDTQISQLPEEYASWRPSSVAGYADLVRKSDGSVLKRTKSSTFSDADLIKMGLSFIPGMAPFVAGYNALEAASKGDIVGAVIGGTGLIPGMENINTALKVGQAIDKDNPFGAVTALAGNTDLQKLVGFDTANLGGFKAKDVVAAGSLAQAAGSNNYAGVLTSLGTLTGSSDTVLAGKAVSLYNRIKNGDIKALGEAVSLSNSVTSGSTGNTASNITTLTDEDLAELQPGELNAYQNGGVQGLVDFRKDMKLLGSLGNSGYAGDDFGGNVAENLINTTANTGATISTDQDILDYINSLGTDTVKDSGLSNQDILNMIGLGADDTVTVTDNKNYDASQDFLTLNNPAGNTSNNYTDDLNEVVITANKDGDYVSNLRNKEIKSDIPDELTVKDIDKVFPDINVNDILQTVTVPGGTKTVVPTKTTTPGTKTTDQTLANLGLNDPMSSQDPYANIKLMEELFGGDTAYKLRSLGAPKNLASTDLDALARLLRG